jgi:lipooligosaccharide transport system permease protein
MSSAAGALDLRVLPLPWLGRGWRLVERNALVYRRSWGVFLTGFLEPLFYLLSIGVGVSHLVHGFAGPGGRVIDYTSFVAPGLLAASAMNGALFDATYNIFFKLKYAKLYDAVLATPLAPRDVARGEITWALLRGGAYSAMFVVVMAAMGLVLSWWAVLALPAALLTAFAFGGAGMAMTTWMRSWQDFEYIQLAILPMFLFSGTFYPLSTYPPALRWFVEVTPLYQAVHLCRALTTGDVSLGLAVPVAYLAAMGAIGMAVSSRRLGVLLLR